MNVTIDPASIPTAQTQRSGARGAGASDGGMPDRCFEDCLAELSTPNETQPRVPNARSRGHEADDRDHYREEDRERARRIAADAPPVAQPSARPVTPVEPKTTPVEPTIAPVGTDAAADVGGGAASNVATSDSATAGAELAALGLSDLGLSDLGLSDLGSGDGTLDVALANADMADAALAGAPLDPAALGAVDAATPTTAGAAIDPALADAAAALADSLAAGSAARGAADAPVEPTTVDDQATAQLALADAAAAAADSDAATDLAISQAPGAGQASHAAGASRRAAASAAADAASGSLATRVVAGSASTPAASGSSDSSGSTGNHSGAQAPGAAPTIAPHGQAVALETGATPGGPSASAPTPLAMTSALDPRADAAHLAGPLRLDIDLGGEGLGPLRMRARAIGSELHMSLSAADAHVRATLLGHANGLRRDLEAAGLEVGSLSVGSSPDQQFGPETGADTNDGSGHTGNSQHSHDRGVGHQVRTRPVTGASATTPVRPTSSRLDLKL